MKFNQLILYMFLFVRSSLVQSMESQGATYFSQQILPSFKELMQHMSMNQNDSYVFSRDIPNLFLHEQILPSFGELIQSLGMNQNSSNCIELVEKNNHKDTNASKLIIDLVDERVHEEQKICTCKCEGCSQLFQNAQLLYQHCRDKHIVEKEGVFYCTWKNCGCNLKGNRKKKREVGIHYTTTKKRSLVDHFIYHCEYKRFKCSVCVPVFGSYRKSQLKKHIEKCHTNAKIIDVELERIYDN